MPGDLEGTAGKLHSVEPSWDSPGGLFGIVVSESSDFLHGNSRLPEFKQKLPVFLKGTHGPDIVSLLPYFFGQSRPRPAQSQRERTQPSPPNEKMSKKVQPSLTCHMIVFILEPICRLNELIHIKCLKK